MVLPAAGNQVSGLRYQPMLDAKKLTIFIINLRLKRADIVC